VGNVEEAPHALTLQRPHLAVPPMLHQDNHPSIAPRSKYLPFGRPDFGDKEIAAVTKVLQSGWVGMGPEVIAFEEELSTFFGAPHVVTVNSCTSALQLSLLVCGVGPGDEVICPSLTWCSTANAALYVGARPVFCDVDPKTLCLTPETVTAALSPRTKAVMVVHFGGLAVDVVALQAALPPGVILVEDAAHALGAHYPDGKPVGSSGNPVCFSFYANKNLSTAEGGAIALGNAAMAERLRSLRQHGMPANAWMRFTHPQVMPRHELIELGFKMNYTDLQAALGRVQLSRQDQFHKRRLAVATSYARALATTKVRLQDRCLDSAHARHLFIIQLPLETLAYTRDAFVLHLRQRNIGASIHYAPLHQMEFYHQYSRTALPTTEEIAKSILTLPISASMTLADADAVMAHFLQLIAT